MDDSRLHYTAQYLDAYDADTIDFKLSRDVGFEITVQLELRVRLLGVDAPEMRGGEVAAGTVARDFVRERLMRSLAIRVRPITKAEFSAPELFVTPPSVVGQVIGSDLTPTYKKGKFGRHIAVVYYTFDNITWKNLNQELLDQGLAVYTGC